MDSDIKTQRITGPMFVKNMLGFSAPVFFAAFLSFFSTPIVTRLFSTAEVGRINIFIVYLSLISSICYLGFDQAYVRFFNEPPYGMNHKDLLTVCLKVNLLATLFIGILLLLFHNYISSTILGYPGYFVSFNLLIGILGMLTGRYLMLTSRMEQDLKFYCIQYMAITLIGKFSFIFAAFWNPNHKLAIAILTLGYCVSSAIFMYLLRGEISWLYRLRKKVVVALSNFALPLMPATILATLNNSVSQMMLNAYVDYSAIGIYSSAVTVAAILSLIQGGFNSYWTAFVWSNYKTEQRKIQQIHHMITFTMVACGLGIILFQNVIYLLFGQQFRASRLFFPILLVSPIAYTIGETTGLGIGVEKKSYLVLIITIITVVINILACLLLLPRIGVIGAAIASAVAAVARLLIMTRMGERYYRCIDSYRKLLIALTILGVACVVNVYLYTDALIRSSIIILLLLVLLVLYKSEAKKILTTLWTMLRGLK